MVLRELLKYLQCPNCLRGNLAINNNQLICEKCSVVFNVVDNIPILFKKGQLGYQEKNQIKIFDSHYSKFSGTEYKLENWRESMLNRIFENDFKSNIKTYLDIGCGATGYTVIEGARRNGWLAIGIDSSIEAMARAKKLADQQGVGDKTAFIVCSAENLPFKSGVFDYISAISVLEHLYNDKKAVENISRILKRNGYVYVCVPNAYLKIWPFLWPFYYYFDLKVGHKRHYSVEKIDDYFKKYNLKRYNFFYNGHLLKFYQLFLDKIKKIDNKKWWEIEKKDINQNSAGVQLNAIYCRGADF
ncbi:MAG TPA: methyltransferase domain-containing protein [Candidatus Paceibacterota bacterium]